MTAGDRELATWLRTLGLAPPKAKRWFVNATLYAPRAKSERATLWVEISWDGWGLSLMDGDDDFEWTAMVGERPSSEGSNVRLRPPKTLLDVPRWVAAVGKKRGLQFDCEKAAIISTLKGGKPAMAAWLRGS